jgi:hypothetical protein
LRLAEKNPPPISRFLTAHDTENIRGARRHSRTLITPRLTWQDATASDGRVCAETTTADF